MSDYKSFKITKTNDGAGILGFSVFADSIANGETFEIVNVQALTDLQKQVDNLGFEVSDLKQQIADYEKALETYSHCSVSGKTARNCLAKYRSKENG